MPYIEYLYLENLNLEKIEILKISNKKDVKLSNKFINLKELYIIYCFNLKIPNNLFLINLQKLEIYSYNNLNCILNNLINLQELIIYNCNNINFPKNLINLQKLTLNHCSNIKIPKTLINL